MRSLVGAAIRHLTTRILDALFLTGLFLTWLREPGDT